MTWYQELWQTMVETPTAFLGLLLLDALIALGVWLGVRLLLIRWSAGSRRQIETSDLWDDERKASERERITLLGRYGHNLDAVLAGALFVGLFAVRHEVPGLSAVALSVRDWLVGGGLASLIRIAILAVVVSVLLSLVRKAAKALTPVSGKVFSRQAARAATIRNVIESAAQITLITLLVIFALGEFGAPIGPLLAGVGVLGLAISFGAQSLVKDIINGFFITIEDQYGVGDVVIIGGLGGLGGLVESVNLRITTLRDLEGRVHIIPNGQVDRVTVMSKEWSRALLDIEVAYKTDLQQALDTLRDEATRLYDDAEWRWRIMDPPEVLGVERFGNSGITLRLMFKTLPKEQWAVAREFRRRIKARFDQDGIEIPFPHVTFYWGEGQMPRLPQD
jgi:small conductance mechanosensitive channel